MSDIYYVYLLLDPRNYYAPFYIGKGKKGRWKDHLSPSRDGQNHFKNSVITKIKATGQDIPVLIWQTNMSEKDAYDLEIELIARFGRRIDESGILTNLTLGGEGGRGIIHTPKFREQCRQRMLGAGSPTYGVGHTEEARRKISEAKRASVAAGNVTRHSEEHRQKLKKDNPGGKATARPILQIDGGTLRVLREWPSMNAAAKELGLSKGNLCGVIGKRLKSGGCYWRLVGSDDVSGGNLALPPKAREKHRRTAIQMDQTGAEIKRWDDLYAVAEAHGVKYHTLWAAAKYERPCAGFWWKLV